MELSKQFIRTHTEAEIAQFLKAPKHMPSRTDYVTHCFERELDEAIECFYRLEQYCEKGLCGTNTKRALLSCDQKIKDLLPKIRAFQEKLNDSIDLS